MSSPYNNAQIMGVINVTPDSFSDGGKFLLADQAKRQADALVIDGAKIIDIGAESTRPGSQPVSPQDEWARLEPVLKALTSAKLGAKVSIDTRNSETMLKAIDYDVSYINNVAGLTDLKTLETIAQKNGVSYIAMHMQGTPATMQDQALQPEAAVKTVAEFFAKAQRELTQVGFASERIFMDPGIGFGKTLEANLALILKTTEWSKKHSLVIGISRKSFLGKLLDLSDPATRDAPSKILEMGLMLAGAKIIRTHAVKQLAILQSTLARLP